jgi:hypothetical protein
MLKRPFRIFAHPTPKTMNTRENQKSTERYRDEAKDLLAHLYAQGVLSLILKQEESKRMIVKLGLTIPIVKNGSLLCGRENETIYLFACTRNPDRNNGRLGIAGYRFEIDLYQQNPLKNVPEVREGFRFCMLAVAQVERIEMGKCTYNSERPQSN